MPSFDDLALGDAATPSVIWSYWDKGPAKLSDFRRLCVDTWRAMNPDWEIRVLDSRSVWDVIQPSELPRQWRDMYVPFQADAVRLALLAKYGGVWMDPATICLKPLDWWFYGPIRSSERREGIAGFYFSSWGVEMGCSAEYVENWVLAARRAHPMILRWHALFNSFWDSVQVGTLEPISLPEHDMFRHIDLSFLQKFGQDMRSYLVMHACFKKMIDEDAEMRRIWQQDMLLFRADDHALWHVDEPDVQWSPEAAAKKWLGPLDEAWARHVLQHCPVLKFTKQFATLLDGEPRARLLGQSSPRCCLSAAFEAALAFPPAD
ncbi:unnamed protein product [Polarella glacialis]|uniref:Capsular polysaccharide synthesis protein n=1 Tax=Polarella glacialis TaxID=89957 RepID=A0A813HJW4_POLGL|nr:unnamed protein product [Polarella glacialis]